MSSRMYRLSLVFCAGLFLQTTAMAIPAGAVLPNMPYTFTDQSQLVAASRAVGSSHARLMLAFPSSGATQLGAATGPAMGVFATGATGKYDQNSNFKQVLNIDTVSLYLIINTGSCGYMQMQAVLSSGSIPSGLTLETGESFVYDCTDGSSTTAVVASGNNNCFMGSPSVTTPSTPSGCSLYGTQNVAALVDGSGNIAFYH